MLFGVEWMQEEEDLKMVVVVMVVLLENGKRIRGVAAVKPLSPVLTKILGSRWAHLIACLQGIKERNTGTNVCRGDGHAKLAHNSLGKSVAKLR